MVETVSPDDSPPEELVEAITLAAPGRLLTEIEKLQSDAIGACALMELLNIAAGSPGFGNDELLEQVECMSDE